MDPEKIKPEDYFFVNKAPVSQTHHLSFRDLFVLSLRVFRTRPLRTTLTILGISLGVGTVLFLISLGYGLQYILIGKLAATEDSLITLDAYYPSESTYNITQEDIDKINKLEGIEEINPVGEFTGEVASEKYSGFMMIRIADPSYFRLSGTETEIGAPFKTGKDGIVISSTGLELLDMPNDATSLDKNLSIKIFYPAVEENGLETKTITINEPLPIKGIISDELQQPFILISSDLLNEKPPYYQHAFIKAEDITFVEPLRDELLKMGFLISARIDLVNQAKKIMSIITAILGIFGITALLVSAIGMFNTMVIGFLERIFEVGIMKAVGATTRDIRNLFLMESLIMGVMGGAVGILIGVGAGEIFNFGLNILAQSLGGKSIDLFIRPWWFLGLIMLISILIGVFSGFWPARRAAKLSPKEAFVQK